METSNYSANDTNVYHEHPSSHSSDAVNVDMPERLISVAVGSFLIFCGVGHKPLQWKSIKKSLIGSYLLYRGLGGYCPIYKSFGKEGQKTRAINIRTTVIVNKPRAEVYAYWRQLENLPSFMHHLFSVTKVDDNISQWTATIPGEIGQISWEAKIVKDEKDKLISWESLKNSTIENAGKIYFRDALGGKGTEVNVMITYRAPIGEIGRNISRLLNPWFKKMVRKDTLRFKDYIEKE